MNTVLRKEIKMTEDIIKIIEHETVNRLPKLLQDDLKEIILFGSYARGDYTEESDIDIAVLVGCDRKKANKYKEELVEFSAELDLKNLVVVNFVCLPYGEYEEKKSYYPFYSNIAKEGRVLYA